MAPPSQALLCTTVARWHSGAPLIGESTSGQTKGCVALDALNNGAMAHGRRTGGEGGGCQACLHVTLRTWFKQSFKQAHMQCTHPL
eukprot:195012-Chlamydomonas_euryale.AAC.1